MEDKLAELTDKLRKAHRDKLISVILYGSAAAGDHDKKFSDLNVVCVLRQVTPLELAASEPVFKWWRALGNPAPLLLSESEIRTATDCFPIEFHDMQERRRVLAGEDVIAGVVVDNSFYRAQVEHELRAKLLRLRQRAAGVMSDKNALLRLMLESVSTFLVLARHALLLSGIAVGWQKRDVTAKLRESRLDASAFETLLALREDSKRANIAPGDLLVDYLKQIEGVAQWVDGLER